MGFSFGMEALEHRTLFAAATAAPPPPVTFGALQMYTSGEHVGHLAVGDFNGDGFADVALTNRDSNSISVFINAGNGTFAAPVKYKVFRPENVIAADFLGNGKIDLAVIGSAPNSDNAVNISSGSSSNDQKDGLSLFIGNGDGTFNPTPIDYKIRRGTRSAVAGDFNHDGLPDLAVTGQFGLTTTQNAGNGVFAPQVIYRTGDGNASYVTKADLNNDGNPDLILAKGSTSKLRILLGDGSGTFTLTPKPVLIGGINPISITTGDFNGDGNQDLVVAGNGFRQGMRTLLGSGDGTFSARIPTKFTGFLQSVAAGDFNNDGKPDVVAVDFTSSLQVFVGNGDGTFQTPERQHGGTQGFVVGVADLNNDGKLDLLFSRHNSLEVLLNTTGT